MTGDDTADDTANDTAAVAGDGSGDDTIPEAPKRSVRKIATRILFVVGALALSAWILATAFDDLDWSEVATAARGLNDAELLSLGSMWLIWVAAQGLLTASLVPGLPVRRGVVAYLGPAAITSAVPGPSDLPVRYAMLTSWGRTAGEASLAVAAGGIFSIGIKLVLPVIAALGLVVTGAPIDGTLQTVVTICLVVGVGIGVVAVVLGSERLTKRVGELLDPVWRLVLRLLRKPDPADLADQIVSARASAIDTLHDRWLVATWATFLTSATKFALLLMCLRFTGVGEDDLPWTQVFVVYALVQGLTVVPITPGDAGVTEVAYIGMLTAAAGSGLVNEVTAAVLVFRLLTWLLVIPVGLGTLGLWRHQLRRSPAPVTAGSGPPMSASGRPADGDDGS